ncbi:MAG: retropepsin-like domain-containing protein [Bacteroidales bacterium]|nr:retropepsin-like domain-containing protein [Bacteroidales bacterium]
MEGTFKGLRFLVDTGATRSLVWSEAVADYGEDLYVHEDDCYGAVTGTDGTIINTIIVHARMVLGGKETDVRMHCIQESSMYEQMTKAHGFSVAGIIGMDVIAAQHWIIDVANQCIRCNEVNSNVA